MKSFLLSSILLLLLGFSSCSPAMLKGFQRTGNMELSRADLYPVFQSSDSTHLFNMQIDYRKNHFSGILLVKPTGDGVYRTVFNTHFGMSIFDFEVSQDTFKVNNCFPALNKKKVLQVLENDLKTLFLFNLQADKNVAEVYKSKDNTALEINKIEKYYYLKNQDSKTLLQIEAPHFISSLDVWFTDYKDQLPAVIKIKHSNIGLKMELDRIERE